MNDMDSFEWLLCPVCNSKTRIKLRLDKKANATGSIYLEDIHSLKAKYDELIQVYGNVLQQFNEIAEAIY